MSKYDIVLFDLDGTLTDPGEGITNSVIYALNKFGISEADKKALCKFIGPPLSESFQKFYGFSENDANKAVEYYREYFKDKGIFENFVYDGIKELLSEVRSTGKCICLATSKPEVFAERILWRFGLSEYFNYTVGSYLDGRRVNKSEVVSEALRQCGAKDPSRVLMVGDREHDIIGAVTCGIDSCGVLWGYGSREEFSAAGATYTVQTTEELKRLIISEK